MAPRLISEHDWEELLATYPDDALIAMARALDEPSIAQRSGVGRARLLSRIHANGRAATVLGLSLDDSDVLTLRLVHDAGDRGMAGRIAEQELAALRVARPVSRIRDLLQRGALLCTLPPTTYWRQPESPFRGSGHRRARLFVHPGLIEIASATTIPGDQDDLRELKWPVRRPVHAFSLSPALLLQRIQRAAELVGSLGLLFTQSGELRKRTYDAIKREGMLTADTLPFPAWVELCDQLDLVEERSDGRWVPTPRRSDLTYVPLTVLANLPARVPWVALEAQVFYGSPWATARAANAWHHRELDPDWRVELGTVCVRAIADALDGVLADDPWFHDAELLPLLSASLRRWHNESAYERRYRVQPELRGARQAAADAVAHVLDVGAHLGLFERGTDNERRVSRVTALGRLLLPTAASRPRPPAQEGGAVITGDGLVRLGNDARGALLRALLADSVETIEGELTVTAAGVSRALAAGIDAEALRVQLRALLAGGRALPAAFDAAFDAALAGYAPARISDDVAALEFVDEQAAARAGLNQPDIAVFGRFVVGPLLPLRRLMRERRHASVHAVDYGSPVTERCTFSPSGELVVPAKAWPDLRLRAVLEAFGLPDEHQPRVRLSADDILDFDDLPERQQAQRLNTLLTQLSRHTEAGIPSGVRLELEAEAGLVDAPRIDDFVVVEFPAATANGLTELRTLDGLAERIGETRFLVPAAELQAVEERLSGMGIPFPAERSALRRKAEARSAMARLQEALSAPEAPAAPEAERERVPAPATPAVAATAPAPARAPYMAPEAPAPSPAGGAIDDGSLLDRTLEIVRTATNSGDGATLAHTASALGLAKPATKKLLVQLVRSGAVTLSGHARGARYRTR